MKSYCKKHYRVQYHPATVNRFPRKHSQPIPRQLLDALYGKKLIKGAA